jgi:hypothetical protein
MAQGGYDGVVAGVAQLYRERLAATGGAPAISAPTNTDAYRIAEGVRAERSALGMLGPDLRVVRATDGERDYALRLARGDKVRVQLNWRTVWRPQGRHHRSQWLRAGGDRRR